MELVLLIKTPVNFTSSKMAKIRRIGNTLKFRLSMADQPTILSSAALVGSNDDLLTQILGRLPVTSVLRFKSVSKHWNSLLTHRRFTLLHHHPLNLSLSPGFFLRNFYIPFQFHDENPTTPPPLRTLDFHPDRRGIRIVQSCNGLLLCCSVRGKERDRNYYIFNPTTSHFAIVPSLPGGMDVGTKICFMGLAFHQTDCPRYKVICIIRVKKLFQIHLYSSDIGKWKICVESFSALHMSFYNGVYWNQAIHWTDFYSDVWYFKLDEEQLQKVSLPEQVDDFRVPYYLGECGGHLHLVERHNDESCLHVNVYEMMIDHSGWFLKYQVELDELPAAYPEMIHSHLHPLSNNYYEFQVFDLIRGEEEEAFMVVGIPGKMIRFNLMDKSSKQIFDLTNIFRYGMPYPQSHRYTQTLNPKHF